MDFKDAVNISREVYQLYGKEKEFDSILERLINNYSIYNGSLNENDDNCITKASENKILLSGTYYDVILLCHEIGHKLRYSNSPNNSSDLMDTVLFETPSIIFEFAANDYLRDYYNVDIDALNLRKNHILSSSKQNNVENSIFETVIKLMKEKKLDLISLYKEFSKNGNIVDYLNNPNNSVEEGFEEGLSYYSYDIGYILGNYVNNSSNKKELLDILLRYKDMGLSTTFTIGSEIIEEGFQSQKRQETNISK